MSLPESVKQARAAVVEQLVQDIQEKGFEWQKVWVDCLSPRNAITGKKYTGGNVFHLACIARMRGYKDPRWCTFKQAKENGWKVKRGAKSAKIEHWKLVKVANSAAPDDEEEENVRPICVGVWSVFNAEEIEGIPELESNTDKAFDDYEIFDIADDFVSSSRCPIIEGQKAIACYNPVSDCVNMPARNSFNCAQSFLRVLLHEMSHSTGNAAALDRPFSTYGTESYAFEELIAELSSAFVASEIGLAFDSESVNPVFYENHAAYLQNWVSVLNNDPNELFRAATKADAAANYILTRYNEAHV